jgi:hypothetical protein
MQNGIKDFVLRLVFAIAGLYTTISGYPTFKDPLMQFVLFTGMIVSSIGLILSFIVLYCTISGRYN